MEILVGDVHGSIKQFLYPFYSNGFCDGMTMKNNEIVLENLNLHGNRIIFIGDIFYKNENDVIIANTLSKMILDGFNIDWILGNRDLLVFWEIFKGSFNSQSLNESIKGSFNDQSLKEQPNETLNETINETVNGEPNETFNETLKGNHMGTINVEPNETFNETLNVESNETLNDQLNKSIKGSFNDSINGSFNETLKGTIDPHSHSFKDSPFYNRFGKINKERLKRLILERKLKVVTRLKNNLLVSHAAITQDGINEIKQVFETGIVPVNPEVKINKELTIKKNIQFDSLEDLNEIFMDVDNIDLYCSFLKIFWNKHIFEGIEESVIGHETFINEYPKEAIPKVQKYGTWLTDEYISMNIQSKNDRIKQFLLTEVHYEGNPIKTNLHHIDCNCSSYENPCYFALKNNKWIFNGNDIELTFNEYTFNGRTWKVLGNPLK